ncbi:MAG: glucodextranase DOMON-like domain-containing protein, partial [Thermoplasmata archaeon]
MIREDFAWEIAISARGWDVYAMIGNEKVRTGVTADADWNSTAKKWDNNTVFVRVAVSLIGSNYRNYGYVIVVGSQDEYGPGKWRNVNAQKERWRFGGGTDGDVDPNIIDMIVPAGYSQKNLLSYDETANKKAVLVGITLPKKAGQNGGNNTTQSQTQENIPAKMLADFSIAILLCTVGAACITGEYAVKRIVRRKRISGRELVNARLRSGAEIEDIELELEERLIAGEITEKEYNEAIMYLGELVDVQKPK